MNQHITIKAGTPTAEISTLIKKLASDRFTHVSNGDTVQPLDVLKTLAGKTTDTTLTVGSKRKGRPFEARPLAKDESLTDAAPPAAKVPKTRKPRSRKVKKKKVNTKTAAPVGTGFVALIDKLLTDVEGPKMDGFIRSKYTVDEALKEVMRKFPEKNHTSVKKIIKVRPRHLERRKDGVYDDAKTRAPRWRVVGPGKNGSMTEIDQLHGRGKSVAEIVQYLVVTHGRDEDKAKEVVKSRIDLLKQREKEEAKK